MNKQFQQISTFIFEVHQNDRAGMRVHAAQCEIHPELSCTIKRNLRDQTASVVKEFNYLYDDKLATGINVRNQQVPCIGQFLFTEYASITDGLHEMLRRCLSYESLMTQIIS